MKKQNALADILVHSGTPGLHMTMAAIMTLAMPAIIEQMMITMVQYIDTAMVGSLGSVATAAIGITASSTWLVNGFLAAASIGFSVQVAQYVGARDYEKARHVTMQAIRFIFIFGIAMGAIAFALSYPLPQWLGANEEVYPLAAVYFRIYACSVPFSFCSVMLGAIFRCAGDTKTPMILNLSINGINVILNFLMIYPTREINVAGLRFQMFGAGLGVAGASAASLLSLLIVSVLYMVILYRRPSPIQPMRGISSRFDRAVLKTVWNLGLPVALERTLLSSAQVTLTAVISGIGTVAVAANHLAVTAEALSYMPAYGVAAAATTMVGQAMGAGRPELAKRFSRLVTYIGILIMTLGGILLFVLAPYLIRLFSTEAEVIDLGTKVLRIVAFAEPCFGMAIVISGVLRGAGDTKAPFLISLITMWGVRVTMALLVANALGLVGVWLAMAVELCTRGVLFMVRLYRDKWLKIRLIPAQTE